MDAKKVSTYKYISFKWALHSKSEHYDVQTIVEISDT